MASQNMTILRAVVSQYHEITTLILVFELIHGIPMDFGFHYMLCNFEHLIPETRSSWITIHRRDIKDTLIFLPMNEIVWKDHALWPKKLRAKGGKDWPYKKIAYKLRCFFLCYIHFPVFHKLHHTLSNSCLTVYNLQSSRVTEMTMSSINDL